MRAAAPLYLQHAYRVCSEPASDRIKRWQAYEQARLDTQDKFPVITSENAEAACAYRVQRFALLLKGGVTPRPESTDDDARAQ